MDIRDVEFRGAALRAPDRPREWFPHVAVAGRSNVGKSSLLNWLFKRKLARVAKVLGYRVIVCDAREVFATRRRFPMADEVKVTWPTPVFEAHGEELGVRDVVCILTHDPKFDVPAVQGALDTRVGYIGVMGSRSTHERRTERLIEAGITPDQLNRLMSPIGLDIGARTPEETAVSICAEIIARRTGRNVPSLRDGDGAIHS